MKIIKKFTFAALAALAATLLFQTSITQAGENLPTFTKITTGPVVTDTEGSAGFAWLDADNDNFLDLYVSNLDSSVLDSFYQNKGDGTFVKVTTNAITTKLSSSFVGVVGDYDNDGDEDLFVAHPAGRGNDLYRNEGARQFTRLTSVQAGPLVGDRSDSLDAAWADYDRDGFIDLFVANGSGQNDALYRNNRDGTFTRMTTNGVGFVVADRKHTGPCNWVDYDNDGYPDLWVGTSVLGLGEPVGTHFLYHNNGDGAFSRVSPGSMALQIAGALAAWADYDNDGFPDLFMANYPGVNSLHRNLGGLTFTNIAESAGLAKAMASWSGAWGDYDNDGFQDLFVINWQSPNALFHNNGDGTFTSVDVGSPIRDGFRDGYGGWADYDNDGFLDLFISNGFAEPDQNLLYRNNGSGNHWLKVKLVGRASNRSGIGAKVRVRAVPNRTLNPNPTWQMREISGNSASSGWQGLVAHFGVGQAAIIDTVRIEWPSGIVQELHNGAVKQFLTITEPARLQVLGAGAFRVESWKGMAFEVQASTDLDQWSPLTTVTNLTGTLEFTDPNAANQAWRFYRVRGTPPPPLGQVTFTKWITAFPNLPGRIYDMAGVVGGDVGNGTFTGEVLLRVPGPVTTELVAFYHFTGPEHSFTALVHVEATGSTPGSTAVIVGVITDGWQKGHAVAGKYTVITCDHVGRSPPCFEGTLEIESGTPPPPLGKATFTKWITAFPNTPGLIANMAGVVGGDVGDGSFTGEVLKRDTVTVPGVTEIVAFYRFNGPKHSFTALNHVVLTTDSNGVVTAVIVGVVTDGWLKGHAVEGEFTVIKCDHFGLIAPNTSDCFEGTLDLN